MRVVSEPVPLSSVVLVSVRLALTHPTSDQQQSRLLATRAGLSMAISKGTSNGQRNGTSGHRRYPPAPVGTKNAVQNRGARPARLETRIPADQRSGLDGLSRGFRSGLRHAYPAQGRHHPQPHDQWRRGGGAWGGAASTHRRLGAQVLYLRKRGSQKS